MGQNRNEQRAARRRAEADGISYTAALRLNREERAREYLPEVEPEVSEAQTLAREYVDADELGS